MKPGLYQAKKQPQYYNGKLISSEVVDGRPVNKVEVTKVENGLVFFETDYPVAKLTLPVEDFAGKFAEW